MIFTTGRGCLHALAGGTCRSRPNPRADRTLRPVFSVPDILVVSVLALLLFGPDRLPKMMRQAGRFMREVQNTSHSFISEMDRAADMAEAAAPPPAPSPAPGAAPSPAPGSAPTSPPDDAKAP